MRVLVFGNSGSGKSTLARHLAHQHGLAHLDLDSIVWEPGEIAVQRSAGAVAGSLATFLAEQPRWVIEGCYGELVQAAASHCTELVFLNPGLETCLQRNRRRPWEPHKYGSKEAQDAMLDRLQAWVAGYYERQDQWSYHAHRSIFDAFPGRKSEYVDSRLVGAGQAVLADAASRRGLTQVLGESGSAMSAQDFVREYIKAYNARDVDAMLAFFDDACVFENISAGRVTVRTEGKAALEALARRSADAFASRQQRVRSLTEGQGRVVAEIDYHAVPRVDLSPDLKAGSELQLRGVSVVEFADGKITRLSDYS